MATTGARDASAGEAQIVTDEVDVERAEARALAARERLRATFGRARERLSAQSLAEDAVDGIKDGAGFLAMVGVKAAQRRPGFTMAASAAIGLMLARRSGLLRDAEAGDATATTKKRSKIKRASAPERDKDHDRGTANRPQPPGERQGDERKARSGQQAVQRKSGRKRDERV